MIRLLVNGTVLTQDDSLPVAQALAALECRPEAVKDLQVLQTWVEGARLTGRSLVTVAGQ